VFAVIAFHICIVELLVLVHLSIYAVQEAVAKGTLQTPSARTNPSSLNAMNPSTVFDSPSTTSTSESSFRLKAENVMEDGVGMGKEMLSSLYMYCYSAVPWAWVNRSSPESLVLLLEVPQFPELMLHD
jgi:hypothetical protein